MWRQLRMYERIDPATDFRPDAGMRRVRWRAAIVGVSTVAISFFVSEAVADDPPERPLLSYQAGSGGSISALWGAEQEVATYDKGQLQKVKVWVPPGMAAQIQDMTDNPGTYPNGALDYVLVVKSPTVKATRCHSHAGDYHCHGG